MKFYENKKTGALKEINVLGFNLYKSRELLKGRKEKIFGNFIRTDKYINEHSEEKIVYIFGKVLFRKIIAEGTINIYIGRFLLKKESVIYKFRKEYKNFIDKRHDGIFIFHSNNGEIFLFLTYISRAFFHKNGIRNPLFLATKKSHAALAKMLCPEIPCCLVNNLRVRLLPPVFTLGDQRVYVLFKLEYFSNVIEGIRSNSDCHFFLSMLNYLEINKEDLDRRHILTSNNVHQRMIRKVAKTGLALDNFVLVAPEANSCEALEAEFWIELCRRFQKEGVDIFLNLMHPNNPLLKDNSFKTCHLSFEEVFALSKLALSIVALRSGLTDIFTLSNIKMHTIYTPFCSNSHNALTAGQFMSGFGLSMLPNYDRNIIHEYNADKMSCQEVINEILANELRESGSIFKK